MKTSGSSSSRFVVVLAIAALALAQIAFPQTDSVSAKAATAPVAYVYVSSSPSSGNFEINEYAAAANGKLTPVIGSPYTSQVRYMALNGKWLFGTDGVNIYSLSIATNGSLNQVSMINAQALSECGDCGGPVNLFLDHTGATLYDEDYLFDGANNAYQSFSVDQSTGQLNYLGATSAASPQFNTYLRFIGNNQYAYGSTCYHFNPDIYGFVRNSDGTLTALTNNPPMPVAKSGDGYCPYLAAADPTNHVAVSVTPDGGGGFGSPVGPTQLAVYTADSAGNLTTTSTYKNMPATLVGNVQDLSMAPSGKLLAVAGDGGLQVFHFNGANPVTHYTGLLTKDSISQMFWDNANHLYALSATDGRLFVFTITPAKESVAPGSPYKITSPQNVIVLPKS